MAFKLMYIPNNVTQFEYLNYWLKNLETANLKEQINICKKCPKFLKQIETCLQNFGYQYTTHSNVLSLPAAGEE